MMAQDFLKFRSENSISNFLLVLVVCNFKPSHQAEQ